MRCAGLARALARGRARSGAGPCPAAPQDRPGTSDGGARSAARTLRHRELPYWFEHLADQDLTYFQYNGVTDHPAEPFGQFCNRLFGFMAARTPARLVIDMRFNGGGNTFLGQPAERGQTFYLTINPCQHNYGCDSTVTAWRIKTRRGRSPQ